MEKLRFSPIWAILLLVLLILVSCGDEDDDSGEAQGPSPQDDDDDDSTEDDDNDAGDDDDSGQDPCGDGVCSEGEDCLNCLADCECSCGDGVCSFGEFCAICPADCDCETLAATPPMGWNTWNRFGCAIDEQLIRDTADLLVESGMRDAGYVYLNLDDCWQSSRDVDGAILADPERFPSGIPALADYVHSKGLRFGLYTCAGDLTCQGKPGSKDYEFQDAQTYADWNVDYVKVDWCYTEGLNPKVRYGIFREALDAAGGGIVLSICDWGRKAPWIWGPATGELWRTTGDISDLSIVMWWNMIQTEPLAPFAGPGAWNDPDMLEVGNGGMNDSWYRTHMSLWAMMAAPLIAGNDLREMSDETLEILTNPEVIAVDQDPSGVQGIRLGNLGGMEVWVRPLTLDGARAVVLFNDSFTALAATVTWEQIGLASKTAGVRDLWSHQELGWFNEEFTTFLEPFESKMILVFGVEHQAPAGESELSALPWKFASGFLRTPKRDMSTDENPLTIGGETFATGLGVTAASQILYHLGGRCTLFEGMFGIDDETEGEGSVVFQVRADGELLFNSGIIKGGDPAQSVQVDLAGRRELKLTVTPAGDNGKGDHADWAAARLVCLEP